MFFDYNLGDRFKVCNIEPILKRELDTHGLAIKNHLPLTED
jgi:hypothetical protein